jgi:hypothetical protein
MCNKIATGINNRNVQKSSSTKNFCVSQQAHKFKRNCKCWRTIHKFQCVANYYFNLLQVSRLLQNVGTSNFRNLILLSSISLFLKHWISFSFLFISHILTEISPLFTSCLIVCLQSFCDGLDNSANWTHFQKTAMRVIITLYYDTTADDNTQLADEGDW